MIDRPDPPAGSEKTVFFCPTCGFAGNLNEEFTVNRSPDAIRYTCPECTALVEERPTPTGA